LKKKGKNPKLWKNRIFFWKNGKVKILKKRENIQNFGKIGIFLEKCGENSFENKILKK